MKTRVWIWRPNKIGSWHFVTIDKKASSEILKSYHWPRRGFGSIPVNVTVGKTTWKTSVFPEKEGAYLLPIKKTVRDNENIKAGDTIQIELEALN